MFATSMPTLFPNTQSQPSHLFENLFKYIKKNKEIPAFLDSIHPDDPMINQLCEVIQNGDLNAEIFNHPNCYLYLLYLLKKEKIPFINGITTYIYLMVLMQFTSKQELRKEDADVKMLREVAAVRMADQDNNLTSEGLAILYFMNEATEEKGKIIDLHKLKTFVLNSPSIEQWLIRIPCKVYNMLEDETGNDFDDFISDFLNTIPFFYRTAINHDSSSTFYIPPFSLILYVLQNNAPWPMIPEIAFGSLQLPTYQKLHRYGMHPILLYAPAVKSNALTADGFRCGSVGMLIHDLSHLYSGSFLSPAFKSNIFYSIIPKFERSKEIASNYQNTKNIIEMISNIIVALYDLDLLGPCQKDYKERCDTYLKTAILGNDFIFHCNIEKKRLVMGELQLDLLYFLMESLEPDDPDSMDDASAIWQTMIGIVRKQVEDREWEGVNYIPNGQGIEIADNIKNLANGSLDIEKFLSKNPKIDPDFKIFLQDVSSKKNESKIKLTC